MSAEYCQSFGGVEGLDQYPLSPCFVETAITGLVVAPALFFLVHILLRRQLRRSFGKKTSIVSVLMPKTRREIAVYYESLHAPGGSFSLTTISCITLGLEISLLSMPLVDGLYYSYSRSPPPPFHTAFLLGMFCTWAVIVTISTRIRRKNRIRVEYFKFCFFIELFQSVCFSALLISLIVAGMSSIRYFSNECVFLNLWRFAWSTLCFVLLTTLLLVRAIVYYRTIHPCRITLEDGHLPTCTAPLPEAIDGENIPPGPAAEPDDCPGEKTFVPRRGRRGQVIGTTTPYAGLSWMQEVSFLFSYMWPQGSQKCRLFVIGAILFLVLGRWVNMLLPLQYKKVTHLITRYEETDAGLLYPVLSLLMFVLLKFLQGNGGLFSSLQGLCWTHVGQHTTRQIALRVFKRLHQLSLQFHLSRRPGEILRAMDRGVDSVAIVLNLIVFNIVPTLIDVVIACVYFCFAFDIWFGYILFITMVYFIAATILITEWRTKYRCVMNELETRAMAKAVDSFINYETVKHYNAEDFEAKRYHDALGCYQWADYATQISLYLLFMLQTGIVSIGLLLGCLVCIKRIADGQFSVGDFILYMTWSSQLYAPINLLGGYYRSIQQNVVDLEKMLHLLHIPLDVDSDAGNSNPATLATLPAQHMAGSITFENVWFSHQAGGKDCDPDAFVLRNLTFHIPAGQCAAIVGLSGGGKSTILKLLLRFHHAQRGNILIAGVNLKHISSHSLRSAIGVVPQDVALFHDTVMYNIRYGCLAASDEQVIEAAKAAQIHHTIATSFPDGYNTMVGERGLCLSGGEKQRIAIARMMLKNAKIIVLDEATSALDVNTERSVYDTLKTIIKNKTTIIVAHRLATVAHVDQILVLKDGAVVESGRHDELLRIPGGLYSEMWIKQQESGDGTI